MPTLADIAQSNADTQSFATNAQANQTYSDRRQQAQQASQLFQQGDVKGAYSILMQDPEFASKNATTVGQIVPEFAQQLAQQKTLGENTAEHQFESTKGDVAKIEAAGKVKAAQATQDKPVKVLGPDGNISFQRPVSGQVTSTVSNGIQPEQDIHGKPLTDNDGNPISVTPAQDKELKKLTNQFNKDAKPYTDSINATEDSKSVLQANIAGTAVVEKLNTLKGLLGTGRIPERIVSAYGGQAGLENLLENGVSQAEGQGLSPQMQKNFIQLNDLIQQDAIQKYDATLRSRVGQAVTNNRVPAKVAENRFAGVAPTAYQQNLQNANDALEHLKSIPPGPGRTDFYKSLPPGVQAIVQQKIKMAK